LVVLLTQRPTTRYQLLGNIEARGEKRRTAEAGLLVGAAMIGADAVVDVQEEFLPDFHRTISRLTGTAVRAADAEGRFEFRSRWYADRIARVSKWVLALLLLVSLPSTVLASILINAIEQGRLVIMNANSPVVPRTPHAVASNFLAQALFAALIIVAIHTWPIGLASLVRALRWPQFVRPLALTLVAFALRPAYLLIGLTVGGIFSGHWWGVPYHAVWLLDPINLVIVLFSLFLARAAWLADRGFRRLVPVAAQKAPAHRTLGGGLALVASITYTVMLVCYVLWAGYLGVSQFRLPTAENRNAAAAAAELQEGSRLVSSDVRRAELHFRRALTCWEALVEESPSDNDYRIGLATTRFKLGNVLIAQGRINEARVELKKCSALFDSLALVPLPKSKRTLVDGTHGFLRTSECSLLLQEGQSLRQAGNDTSAEVAFRRALDSLRAAPGAPPLAPAHQALREKYEAAACNSLAWLSSVAPGRSPEQSREAGTLAQRSVEFDPENGNNWNTLALAHYRDGKWLDAAAAVERSMKLRGGGSPHDWVVLAMIRWRQGDRAEARRWYDQAVGQIDRQKGPDEDLRRLRDEAAGLLEISASKP
jgi:tetratricopeptide (TPR) repeat protein